MLNPIEIRCAPSCLIAIAGLAFVFSQPGAAQQKQAMPREDVVDVPAIGKGLHPHNLFQSNMVLQRDKPIRVWGWAAPGEKVEVSFDGESQSATAQQDRSWEVTLPARSASDVPAGMSIQGQSKTVTLHNILIGDVWVLGGQSNMEFPLSKVDNGWLEIVSARFEGIRVLTVPAPNGPDDRRSFARLHEWSSWSNRHFRKGDWDVCSPRIAKELSAIGYAFARRVHMATKVPIGVIDVSRGGTTLEAWTPYETLSQIGTPEVKELLSSWQQRVETWDPRMELEARVRNFERRDRAMKQRGEKPPRNWKKPSDLKPGPAFDPNHPGNCYRNMMVPLQGLAVKGVIFHQGFNNALGSGSPGARMYRQVFTPMIAAWRKSFGDPELPFGIISLCTAGEAQTLENYVELMLNDGIYIREAQYQTFLDLMKSGDGNIGFASSFDQRRSWYHPQQKLPVGERISRWALATQYGMEREIKWKPPMLTRMEVQAERIVLNFDRQVSALDNKNPIRGFAIAGEDRKFQPASANWLITGKDQRNRPRFNRKALVLSSPLVPKPIHFRYAWGRNPLGNLQSSDHNDLPFATQRSDSWNMEEVPLGVMPAEDIVGGKLNRGQRRKLKAILRQADIARRLYEAKAFLKQHGQMASK